MDAPTAPDLAPEPMPWDMIPYQDGDFDRMHAPGFMQASASGIPAIFNLVPQRYGSLAYAMHLKGDRALPDPGDEIPVRLGHFLEPFVAMLLSEELGAEVKKLDGYSKHAWLPMYSTPDGAVIYDGKRIVEIKVVLPRTYRDHWRLGPPLHVTVQHQVQYATTGAEAGIIAVFNLGFGTLEWMPTEPDRKAIERIELKVGDFMDDLECGVYPSPDDTEPDFEAFRQLFWQSDPDKKITIKGDEAERRARRFLQAKADEAAAKKTIEADQRWFQSLMKDAHFATIGTAAEIQWKTNQNKGKGQERPSRVFKMKELKGVTPNG